ncbi:hypothetical protein AB1E18_003169 [Capra hircus]
MRVPVLLLVFLAPVMQVSSNMEGEKMSITKAAVPGAFVEIICDLITQTVKYIHWYKYQEGTAPRRLLYYDISYSKIVLESGISEGKYKVYKEKSYTFAISNLQESDSGMYYCAVWEKHVGLDFLYTALEILLVTAKHSHDRDFDVDMSPKPTMFLPSIPEINCDNAGTYLCLLKKFPLMLLRSFNQCDSAGWKKLFGKATELIVASPDRDLDKDMSPKPTMFLPSITEIKRDNNGTYLCLLEDFFPHVIKVYWREKRGNKVLPSQEGKTIKTDDTYMKLSWLTVSGNSMDKEHMCIVKHEKNKRGTNQEILFPAVNEVVSSVVTTTKPPNDGLKDRSEKQVPVANSTKACLKDENNTLQLQLMNTSAYYTYLLLLIKSTVYFAIITSFTQVSSNAKGAQMSVTGQRH